MAENRRNLLIKGMSMSFKSFGDCSKCSGVCCTYQHNSMMITPSEAIDIYTFLKANDLIDPDLIKILKENVTKFRLDYFIGNGKSFLRRTYTCPFFQQKTLGCSLPPESKPYGCLAFNPLEKNQEEGGNCVSQTEWLKKKDQSISQEEIETNNKYKKVFEEHSKLPIPLALLKILNIREKELFS